MLRVSLLDRIRLRIRRVTMDHRVKPGGDVVRSCLTDIDKMRKNVRQYRTQMLSDISSWGAKMQNRIVAGSVAPTLPRIFTRIFTIASIALALLPLALAPAHADNFPSRPITLIVPFPPGGSTDVAARIMADKMGAALGQPVIVENVGGAGGSIGVGRLARAAPDGYTIDIGQWDTHVGSIIYNISYDLRRDFAPIGLISINPMLLVANKALPADDLKSLVAYMKAHPGDAKFVNQNASAQVGGLLLQKLTGTEVLFVPYRGAGPAMTDLISGQVDLLLVQGAVALPQVRAGTIKALAELSPDRSASMPDIPSAGESGVPGLNIAGWFGFYAPKGTPPEVIAKLNAATVRALADPAVQARFAQLGLDVAARDQQTPEGFAAFQNAEMDKWWPIIKAAGIRGE
jgi:tripartite-type tricarboxylate transporter receptor subunit TctC